MMGGWELVLIFLAFGGTVAAMFLMRSGRSRSMLGEVPGIGPSGSSSPNRIVVLRHEPGGTLLVRIQYRALGKFLQLSIEPWQARAIADSLMEAYRGARPEEVLPETGPVTPSRSP